MSHSWIACCLIGSVAAIFVYLVYFFPKRVVAAAPWIAARPAWKGFIAMSSCLSIGSVLSTVGLAALFSLGKAGMLESTPVGKLAVAHFYWSAPSALLYGYVFAMCSERYRTAVKYIVMAAVAAVLALASSSGDFSRWAAMIAQAAFGILPLGSIATTQQRIVVGAPQEIVFGQAAVPVSATVSALALMIIAICIRDRIAARKAREHK